MCVLYNTFRTLSGFLHLTRRRLYSSLYQLLYPFQQELLKQMTYEDHALWQCNTEECILMQVFYVIATWKGVFETVFCLGFCQRRHFSRTTRQTDRSHDLYKCFRELKFAHRHKAIFWKDMSSLFTYMYTCIFISYRCPASESFPHVGF